MASPEAERELNDWMGMVMFAYGKQEARSILREVQRRLTDDGLDGASVVDWKLMIRTVMIERHPEDFGDQHVH